MTDLGVRRALAVAITLSLGLGNARPVYAQTLDEAKAIRVKAAYLYNFAKFAEWPRDVFRSADAPIVIGVLGNNPIANALEKTIKGKKVNRHPIVIRRIASITPDTAEEMRGCQLLFVCDCESDQVPKLWELLGDSPVLVVSDMKDFARRGGMIGLSLEGGRIVFEIRRESVDRAGIRLSAKLLKLARIVD